MSQVMRTRSAGWRGLMLGIAVLMVAGQASAQMTVTPITWDVVGLDSNRPLTSGPELFPVGAEVCSALAMTDVDVDFVWSDGDGNGWDVGPGNAHINLRPGSLTSLSFPAIGAGECVDAYFELKLNRSAGAFGQSREYFIQATDGAESATTPSPRAIHVERLVSQNRNTTQQIRYGQQADQTDWVVLGAGGSINLAVDQTYFIELTTQTSTAYEELQSFVTLSNTIFQVMSVSTTYSNLTAPPSRVPVPNPRLWADGCLWDSDLNSPNYLSCLSDGKAGGVVVTTYEIRIISSGGDTVGLEALIYDRSGGSFHYNTDYSESPGDMNTFDPTDSGLSKRFVPDVIGIGGTSRLRFTISNPNPIEVTGYNFIDNLPSGVEVASPPNASNTCGGIWNPLATDTVLAFDGGTIAAYGSCSVVVDVTAAVDGTYDNVSENLFIGTTDTGNSASATLEVSATPPPVLECDDLATLGLWQFTIGGSATAPAPTSSLVAASAAAGAGLTPTIENDTSDVGTGSWSSDFIDNTGPLTLTNNQYFEFVVDTTGLDSITLDFFAQRTSQGAQNIQLYYGEDGDNFASDVYTLGSQGAWLTFGPTTVASGLNSTGNTRFRLYVYNAGQNNNGHAVFIDGVSFRGLFCTEVPPPPPTGLNPPTISKSFSPNPIGVGQQTTLTFTITNPNPTDPLTGVAVSDQLPANLTVVGGTYGGTCTGFWGPDPSDPSVLVHSQGILAAGASCTLTVDVVAGAVGSELNISDAVYATESGYNTDLTTGVAQAQLDVLAPPTIAKDFDPNLVLLGVTPGDASVLTFTITNPNPNTGMVGVSFSDTFPAGLVVANPANGSSSCTGTLTAVSGSGSVSFAGGAISSGGICTVTVDVTGPAGVYPNTTSPVSHVVGGVTATNGDTASDTLQIDQPIPGLAFLKQIGPTSDPNGAWSKYLAVETGDPVYYKFTVENTGEVSLTGISVTDPGLDLSGCSWPDPLPVVDPAFPTDHIAVCIVGPVTTVSGTHTNTADLVTTEVPGPTTDSAIYATAELGLVKTASPTTFTAAGELISYSFTVTNTGDAILAGPVTISDPLVPGATCPALATVGNNDNFFDPAEVIVCTGSYTTQAADVTNLGVTNTASASAGGVDSLTDSVTVTVPVAEPTIAKSFATDPVPVGTTSALTITVTNNAAIALTGVSYSDVLPAGLSFVPASIVGNCGGGTTAISTTTNTNDTFSLTGGGIAASGSCSITVTVNGDVAGSYTNTTSAVNSNEVTGTTTGSTTLDVVAPVLEATKSDALQVDNDLDGVVDPGDTIRYTVVVSNTGTTAATGVVFGDAIPANTSVVAASVTTTQGTVSSEDPVSVTIGDIAAGGSVTITFDVTVDSPFPAGVTQVANQGLVTAGNHSDEPTDDPDTGTDDDPTVTPVEDPGVDAIKTDALFDDADGDGVPSPGDTLEYTVTITNIGNLDLTGVTFVDAIPANTSVVVGSVTTTQGTVNGEDPVDVTVGTIAVGGSATITFRATIDNPLPVGVTQVVNQGTVTTNETPDEPTDDPDTGTDDDPTNTTVTAAPVLDAEKADSLAVDADGNGVPSPGDTLRYTVAITNSGNTAATGVFFTDPIPTNTTVVAGSATTTQGTVNGEDPVDVTIGDIAAGDTVTITFDVVVDDPLPGGVTSVANQGTVSSSELPDVPTDDPDTGADDDPTITPLTAEPVIEATKTDALLVDADGSGDVSPGDTLSYSVTITNSGNTDATGVVFTDAIPLNTTVVAGSVATSQGVVNTEDPVNVSVGSIAAGGSVTISFNVVIDSPLPAGVTEISNQGTVSSNELPDEPTDDPDTGTDDDPTNTPVNGAPDLAITKDDGGAMAVPGGTVVYTLSYQNNGNQNATGVVLTDTVPVGTTFNAGASTAGWACVPDNNPGSVCTLPIGNLAAGASGSADFAVTVDNPVPVGFTQVTNAASVADDGTNGVDPTPGDNSDGDTTPVNAAPVLEATKSDALQMDNDLDGVVDPGDTIRYTVVVSNTGTTAATGVVFGDAIPANTSVVAASVTTTQGTVSSEDPVNVTIGDIAAGGSVTITFDVTVDSPFPAGVTQVANQGLVTAGNHSDEPTDDPDTGTDDDPTVTPVEDPGVDAIKTDALFDDADGDGVPSPGDTLEYTVTITNTGNLDLTGVTFVDAIPVNTTVVAGSVTTTQGTVNGEDPVDVTVGTIAVGGSATITFRVTIDNPLPVGVTQVVNQGTVTTNETPDEPTDDPDTGTDDDPTNTTVTAAPVLDAEKADSLAVDADGNGVPSPGDTLRYTVAITNSGNTAATGVFFTDPIPTNTTVVAGSVTTTQGTVNGDDPVDVTIGEIGAGDTVTITLDVVVDDPLPGGVTSVSNQGTVGSNELPDVPTDDPDTGADDDPTITPLTAEPVIEATKTDALLVDADGSGDVSPGDTLSYSVTISNTGNTDATGVVFTDAIPLNTTVVVGSVATSQGVVNTEDPVNVSVGSIAAGGSVTISFNVVIDSPLPAGVTTISNQGVVGSTELPDEPTDDPDTPADDDPTDTPVNGAPDLSIAKDDGGATAVPGGTVVYTLSYQNNGNQNATGVALTDTVPVGTTFNAGASTAGWACVPDNNPGSVCTLPIGNLAAGASGAADFAVTVDNPVPAGFTQIANAASVADDGTNGPDPTPADNSDGDNTPLVAAPDLSVTKDDGGISAAPGDTISYTLTYVNNGNQVATGVALTETVPAGTTFNPGASTPGWVCVPDGNPGSICTLAIGSLTVGGSGMVSFAVTVDNPVPVGFTQVDNAVSIADDGTNGPDPTPGDNTDSDSTPVNAATDVSATKADALVVDSDGDGVVDPGDTIRYTIVVTNGGSVAATNVVFTDTPDANTALAVGSVTTSQGTVTTGNIAGDTNVGVDIGTLAAAGSVTITFDVTVNSPFPSGVTQVANQGLVIGDGGISEPTDDPDTGTDDDPTVTPVEDPGVEAEKTDALFDDADGDGVPSPGDTLEYTVAITNTGNMDLTGVAFSDTPDANTALVVGSVTTTHGTVTTGNIVGDVSVGVDVGTIVVGDTATITFQVTIDSPLPVGVTEVANQGTVTTNETPDEPTDDPDTGTDDDPTNTTVTAQPMLEAEKADALQIDADGNGIPSPGDTLRYTVVITNSGNTAATGVFFTDPIPTYTTVVAGSVTTTQGTVNGDDPVDVTIGDIAVGDTVTITFDVLIDDPLPGGVTQVENQGTVSAGNHPDEPTDDPDTGTDDDPTITPLTAEPLIEADKTDTLLVDADGSGDVSPGDTLSYSVTITNSGNTDATGVVFFDPIPMYTSVVAGSVATSQGTVDSEDPVQVTVGTMAASATVTISFNVVIDNPLPDGVTEISNQGTVNSNELDDEPTNDPDTGPDDDPTNTPVNGAPDLAITKDDGGAMAVPGGTVVYTLSYQNNGNQTATGVVLTDTVPVGTTFNAGASTAGWACVPGTGAGSVCTLAIGNLAAGASGAASFAVTVDNPVPPGFTFVDNTASIADDGTNGVDPTPGNNTSSDTTPVDVPSSPSLDAFKGVELLYDPNGNQLADPGELLRYTVTIINDGDTVIENAVLRDTPDAVTTLVVGSVTTSQGAVTIGNNSGDASVEVVIGDIAVNDVIVVVFEVSVNANIPPGVTEIVNQGVISSTTIPDVPTDDPATTPGDDPTVIQIGEQAAGIPDLSDLGRLFFVLTLAAMGAMVIRRRLT